MEQSSHPYSYKRIEHLKLRKSIEMVFAQNNVLRSGPIKMIFAVEPSDSFSYQVGFVAPKKVHHFAVDRNRNKRLLREAFRLNRHILTSRMDNKTVKVSFLLVAQNSRPMSFADVETAVRQLLARLSEKVGAEGADL
ncbi:MAG: ribonuclease P protein component [Salinivirgaceae bacterium]|nr:ribonuclease P protein component [Salinivirgaceae bacterium]